MNNFQIFVVQFLGSVLVYSLIARWYITPRLALLPLAQALQPLLLLHSTRTIGMAVLVSGVVGPDVPRAFAAQVAYGDLLAAGLALLSIVTLRTNARIALPLVWIFNVEGSVDLVNAFVQGLRYDVTRFSLGAAWYTPTYIVPALLVTHVMIFSMLLKGRSAK